MLLLADISNLQTASALHTRQRSEEQARRNLFSVLGGGAHSRRGRMKRLSCCALLDRIGRHERHPLPGPAAISNAARLTTDRSRLEDILNASGVRCPARCPERPPSLVAERQRGDAGLRAGANGSPVALDPGRLRALPDDRSPGHPRSAAGQRPSAPRRWSELPTYFYRSLPDASRLSNVPPAVAGNGVQPGYGETSTRLAVAGDLFRGLAMLGRRRCCWACS